jgi:pimeloyl-ACP methyl ester carboxylesterase
MRQMKEPEIRTYIQSDGYVTHYRLWGASEGRDVVVLLHGGMSHSGWQAPLGDAIVSTTDVSFIATDRRGSGLNSELRGHLDLQEKVIDDVVEFLRSLKGSYERVHLAGWCFGGQIASIAAGRVADQDVISTLLLVAPGFFFNERYSDVLRLSIESALEVVKEFELSPEPTRAFIQVPLQPTDFTVRPDWHQFIVDDQLRLTKVTESTVRVWGEIVARAEKEFSQIGEVPLLVVFGSQDKLVDNDRVRNFLVGLKSPAIEELDTGHAVQFEQPEKLAEIVISFVSQTR